MLGDPTTAHGPEFRKGAAPRNVVYASMLARGPSLRIAPSAPARIGVCPTSALERHRRLFDVLQQLFDVRFEPAAERRRPIDGLLAFGSQPAGPAVAPGLAPPAAPGAPVLRLSDPGPRSSGRRDVRVCGAGLDRRLRGLCLAGQLVAPGRHAPDARALARAPDGPVWTVGAGGDHLVCAGLPELRDGETLLQALHGEHALGLIALIELLRTLGAERYTGAGLRAAFVFDDPNLRRRRYGHIVYRDLVAHADAHGYHAAIALVPLDAGGRNAEAVSLFAARGDRISLTIHGNDHAPHELMAMAGFDGALRLCAQALRRIERFEAATGLSVGRVMMPPHGGWSRIAARALGALRFDALCASQDHPPTEPATPRPATAGWTAARFVDGCAVVPRLPLEQDRTGIALRAYIGQPLILYGHHADLADGLDRLATIADLVNGLGPVHWCSPAEIVHGNYDRRVAGGAGGAGGTLFVRPWAGRLQVAIPEGVARLVLQEPPGGAVTGWSSPVPGATRRPFGEPVAVSPGVLPIRLRSAWDLDARSVAAARPDTVATLPRSAALVLRRRLSEARDRLVAGEGARGPR